jgi:transcription elongation factor Elf1
MNNTDIEKIVNCPFCNTNHNIANHISHQPDYTDVVDVQIHCGSCHNFFDWQSKTDTLKKLWVIPMDKSINTI